MTIRSFIDQLHALFPLTVAQLMAKYEMSEADALASLRGSWFLPLRPGTPATVLDDPDPSIEQFIEACEFKTSFIVGNVALFQGLSQVGQGFWAMGHISQESLLINQVDKMIYYADYDDVADENYGNFRPCARTFGCLLEALLLYGNFVCGQYLDAPQEDHLSKEEYIASTLQATGVRTPDNIFAQLY